MRRSEKCILAVDAGGTFLKAMLALPDGSPVEDSFMRMPIASAGTAEEIRDSYICLAQTARTMSHERGFSIAAVGVAIPGPFDYYNGISRMTHKYAAIEGASLRPWITQVVGSTVPICFLHDANAFLLGALHSDHFADVRCAAGVTLGTGLGFASVMDGSLRTNSMGGPYVSIYARPFRDGISEDYISRRGILNSYALRCGGTVNSDIDVLDIAMLARKGQAEALDVFTQVGSDLGAVLHDVMAQYGFECLLLGGAIAKSADLLLPSLKSALHDLPLLQTIAAAEQIDTAPLCGAAAEAARLLKSA